MAQTPPPLPLVSGSHTGAMPLADAGLPGRAQLNVGEASSAMMGEVADGRLRDDACCR